MFHLSAVSCSPLGVRIPGAWYHRDGSQLFEGLYLTVYKRGAASFVSR